MSLLALVLPIVVAGVVLWLVNTYVPMEARLKNLLNIAVICIVVLWVLKVLGLWAYLANIKV